MGGVWPIFLSIFRGLPSAKQWQTAPTTALFIAGKLPLFTELPRRRVFSESHIQDQR
jgi:hypothetical protein